VVGGESAGDLCRARRTGSAAGRSSRRGQAAWHWAATVNLQRDPAGGSCGLEIGGRGIEG
jgi:hypothetical protein